MFVFLLALPVFIPVLMLIGDHVTTIILEYSSTLHVGMAQKMAANANLIMATELTSLEV